MNPTQNNDQKRIFSLLSLATKARRIVSGEFMTEKSIKSGTGRLVIIAEDASDNTKKKFTNMCRFYKVPCFFFGTKEGLGAAMGKEFRACAALTDEGFAKSIHGKLVNSSNMEV